VPQIMIFFLNVISGTPSCVLAQRQKAFKASVLISEVLTKIFNPRAEGLALYVNKAD